MAQDYEERPWEQLEGLVGESTPAQVEAFLDALPAGDAARVVSRLSDEDQVRLLTTIDPPEAADLIEQLPDAQAAEMIERLEPHEAAAIVQELPSDEQADILQDIGGAEAEAILAAMSPEEGRDARALSRYADDVAGGLMVTEYLSFRDSATVADVLDDLRRNAERYAEYDVQYTYVVDEGGRLVGVLRMRDLLLAPAHRRLADLMARESHKLADTAPLDAVRDFFDRRGYFGAPVVDGAGRLVGVVQRAAVEEALADRADSQYLKSQGIMEEELRSMPIALRSRRRLAWLSVNILLNIIAASVIALYQDTLQSVIALAVFLPIISDMSGCSGNQAVAVSMRELTLGLARPADVVRVWRQEVVVGVINGILLGALIGLVAWVWKHNVHLGLVVGAAMALNTVVAVSIGGVVPLALKRLRMDPALASGPILTTITDMCGFFFVLSFATFALARLGGQ